MVDDEMFSCAVTLAAGLLSGSSDKADDGDIKDCVTYCYDVLSETYEAIDARLED